MDGQEAPQPTASRSRLLRKRRLQARVQFSLVSVVGINESSRHRIEWRKLDQKGSIDRLRPGESINFDTKFHKEKGAQTWAKQTIQFKLKKKNGKEVIVLGKGVVNLSDFISPFVMGSLITVPLGGPESIQFKITTASIAPGAGSDSESESESSTEWSDSEADMSGEENSSDSESKASRKVKRYANLKKKLEAAQKALEPAPATPVKSNQEDAFIKSLLTDKKKEHIKLLASMNIPVETIAEITDVPLVDVQEQVQLIQRADDLPVATKQALEAVVSLASSDPPPLLPRNPTHGGRPPAELPPKAKVEELGVAPADGPVPPAELSVASADAPVAPSVAVEQARSSPMSPQPKSPLATSPRLSYNGSPHPRRLSGTPEPSLGASLEISGGTEIPRRLLRAKPSQRSLTNSNEFINSTFIQDIMKDLNASYERLQAQIRVGEIIPESFEITYLRSITVVALFLSIRKKIIMWSPTIKTKLETFMSLVSKTNFPIDCDTILIELKGSVKRMITAFHSLCDYCKFLYEYGTIPNTAQEDRFSLAFSDESWFGPLAATEGGKALMSQIIAEVVRHYSIVIRCLDPTEVTSLAKEAARRASKRKTLDSEGVIKAIQSTRKLMEWTTLSVRWTPSGSNQEVTKQYSIGDLLEKDPVNELQLTNSAPIAKRDLDICGQMKLHHEKNDAVVKSVADFEVYGAKLEYLISRNCGTNGTYAPVTPAALVEIGGAMPSYSKAGASNTQALVSKFLAETAEFEANMLLSPGPSLMNQTDRTSSARTTALRERRRQPVLICTADDVFMELSKRIREIEAIKSLLSQAEVTWNEQKIIFKFMAHIFLQSEEALNLNNRHPLHPSNHIKATEGIEVIESDSLIETQFQLVGEHCLYNQKSKHLFFKYYFQVVNWALENLELLLHVKGYVQVDEKYVEALKSLRTSTRNTFMEVNLAVFELEKEAHKKSEEKTKSLLVDYIRRVQKVIDQWHEIDPVWKVITVTEGVDLQRNFDLKTFNIRYCSITIDQLLALRGGFIGIAGLDQTLIQKATEELYRRCIVGLDQQLQVMRADRMFLQNLKYLTKLECNGKPPDLSGLSDDAIKVAFISVLASFATNKLPEEHRLSFYNFNGVPRVDLLNRDSEIDRVDLEEFLKCMRYKIHGVILRMIIVIHMTRYQESIGRIDIISQAESHFEKNNFPDEYKSKIVAKINESRKFMKEALAGKKEEINKAFQQAIDKTLETLAEVLENPVVPEKGAEDDLTNPVKLLNSAIEIATGDAKLKLDLRKVPLHKMDHKEFHTIKFDKCVVFVTPEQLERVFSQEQQIARTERFNEMIRQDLFDIVKEYVESGINLNQTFSGKDGRTPLMIACFYNKYEIAKYLLANGANPNIEARESKMKAIDTACLLGGRGRREEERNMINLLKEHNSPFDVHNAVAIGDYQLVEDYLKTGSADLTTRRKIDGNCPLHKAAEAGFRSIVALLLFHGADPKAENLDGKTALYLACKEGYVAIAELLLLHDSVDLTKACGAELMDLAIEKKNVDLCKLLLSYGANITEKAAILTNNTIALHDFLRQHLKKGINAPIDRGYNFLHLACKYGSSEVLNVVLQKQPNLTLESAVDGTALEIAAATGRVDIVRRMLTELQNYFKTNLYQIFPIFIGGTKIERYTSPGKVIWYNLSALCTTVEIPIISGFWKNFKGVQKSSMVLKDKPEFFPEGSKEDIWGTWQNLVSLVFHYGQSPSALELQRAICPDQYSTISFASSHCQKALWSAVTTGHAQVVSELLNAGADPNTKNFGRSVLTEAARFNREEIVSLLVAKGANIEDNSPIYLSVLNDNEEMIKVLMTRFVEQQNSRKESPQAIAADHQCKITSTYIKTQGRAVPCEKSRNPASSCPMVPCQKKKSEDL